MLTEENKTNVPELSEAPPTTCAVGGRHGVMCDREATMAVYGLAMCEAHGEEAANGALEELHYDLEQELSHPINEGVCPLSPHMERALELGRLAVTEGVEDYRRRAWLGGNRRR